MTILLLKQRLGSLCIKSGERAKYETNYYTVDKGNKMAGLNDPNLVGKRVGK